MVVKELIDYIERLYPLAFQEEYDHAGCQVLFPEESIQGVLLCLDVNETVIKEAVDKQCNFIISHHPLLFRPVHQIKLGTNQGNALIKAIQHKISIYAVHTNFDNSWDGTNRLLADLLRLTNVRILTPKENQLVKLVTFVPQSYTDKVRTALFDAGAGVIGNYDSCSYNVEGYGTFRGNEETNPFVGEKGNIHFEPEVRIETILPAYLTSHVVDALLKAHPYEEVAYDIYPLANKFSRVGLGMIGYLQDPMSKEAFLWHVKNAIGSTILRYNKSAVEVIQKVAICSGSGASLLQKAIQQQADAYITSDISYHYFADAPSNILLVDAGHYETEIHFVKKMLEVITKKNTNFAVHLSESCLNPVNYF